MFALQAPAKVVWEVTRRCTRRCAFCYNASCPEAAGELDGGHRRNLLNQIVQARVLHVSVTGGEPLLLGDELLALLGELRAREIFVELLTNGDLLDAGWAKELKQTCDLVRLPLMGATAASHDAAMGAGSFDTVMRGVALLEGMPVEIDWLLTRGNHAELDRIPELFAGHGHVRNVTAYPYVHVRTETGGVEPIPDEELDQVVQDFVSIQKKWEGRLNIGLSGDSVELRKLIRGGLFNYQIYVEAGGECLVHQWLPLSAGPALDGDLGARWREHVASFWTQDRVRAQLRGFRDVNRMGVQTRRWTAPFARVTDFLLP